MSQLETRNKQDCRKWREAFRVWSVYFTANLSSLNKTLRGRIERRHSSRWIPAWCLYSSASRSFSTLSRWDDSLAKRTNYFQHWTCSIEYSLINVITSYVDCLWTFLITRDPLSPFFLSMLKRVKTWQASTGIISRHGVLILIWFNVICQLSRNYLASSSFFRRKNQEYHSIRFAGKLNYSNISLEINYTQMLRIVNFIPVAAEKEILYFKQWSFLSTQIDRWMTLFSCFSTLKGR